MSVIGSLSTGTTSTSAANQATTLQPNGSGRNLVVQNVEQHVITPINEDNLRIKVPSRFLEKIKRNLQSQAEQNLPFVELLLFVPSLLIGATFSALTSNVALTSNLGKCLYIAGPIISAGTFVCYIFLKHNEIANPSHSAKMLLEEFPEYKEPK